MTARNVGNCVPRGFARRVRWVRAAVGSISLRLRAMTQTIDHGRASGHSRRGAEPALDDWFLSHVERGNPATEIDRGRGDAEAWTEGNDVTVLVDGASYFPALFEELCTADGGDWIYLTDLQSDGNELLAGPGTEIGAVLADAAQRGVSVRGLLWRSHPAGHGAAEVTNLLMSRTVNDAGGEIVLDHRVRRGGSHHQKIVVVHRATRATADDDVAFVGGIDLADGRSDGPPHHGDEQPLSLSDPRYGDRPPWHDVQLRLRGPVVGDVSWTFRERWEDPNPLDVPTPWRRLRHFLGRKPAERGDLAPPDRMPAACGSACGASAAHVSRATPPVSVRAEGRAQHRPRVHEGVRARPVACLHRRSVPVVDRRDARVVRRAPREPRAALCPRDPSLPGSRGHARCREPLRAMEGRACARASGRRSSRGVRPRERRRHAHLRPREGVHRRRPLDDGRLRQSQPSLVDARLRDLLRDHRRRRCAAA